MMQRPHVSAAVVALRGWVAACCAVVCLAAIVQLFVYCFAAYTDVRYSSVVGDQPAPTVVAARGAKPEAAVDANRVLSVTDRNLSVVSGFATNVGTGAAAVLVVLTVMGVMVAGGGAIPGVEKMVRAAVWAMATAAISVPWMGVLWGAEGALLPGVFCGYATVTSAAEGVGPFVGGVKGVSLFVIMPTAAATISALVAIWFHGGVERGVIVTAVSELDRAVEREVAAIRAHGVTSLSGAGRVLGALNHVLGDAPVDTPRPLRKAAGAEGLSDLDLSRSLLRGSEQPKRPI
ncbi:MAG: hypothetical protein ACT4PL_01730 [Phycisphaerales bacterium]